jgi:erythromycin esterase-like protein
MNYFERQVTNELGSRICTPLFAVLHSGLPVTEATTMTRAVLETLRQEAVALRSTQDIDAAIELIGDARIVMLGEATHGTHEFYQARAEITKRLIAEKGFAAVAVEADWPDALHVNRLIRQHAENSMAGRIKANDALGKFQRFPQWMWRNEDVAELVRWLAYHNAGIEDPVARAGFFGIDLYSLRNSMDAVVQYLSRVDPEAARQARERYACFDHFGSEPQQYGYAVNFTRGPDCEDEVVQQLLTLTDSAARYAKMEGPHAADEAFYAEQNARVAQNAESYYRTMFHGRDESWNVRDTHMADTLDALCEHLSKRRDEAAKVVVWAHNSHIGNASATEMGEHGQINVGQLMRERHGDKAFLLGFTTHTGTVAAASEWDSPAELKKVRPSMENSYERLFHEVGEERFLLPIRGNRAVAQQLSQRRLERAIGVIYLPERERYSHYFYADLAKQFDAVIHFDETRAVKPLDRSALTSHEELPETYPFGF